MPLAIVVMNPFSPRTRGCFSTIRNQHIFDSLRRCKPLRSFSSISQRGANDAQLKKENLISSFIPKVPSTRQAGAGSNVFDTLKLPSQSTGSSSIQSKEPDLRKEPYHLNVYATKHNCHITWTRPNREPILSKSAGNLSFKKGQRGQFDSAYQLSTFVMSKMQEKGLSTIDSGQIEIELILRGFGPGREAFTKALLSSEGRFLQDKISRVVDATRLKFGGTRSRNVRRL